MTSLDYLLVFGAALAAGAVNAIAGGGTLISFPTLTAVGIPAIAANVTNTVALAPGYLGATLAQARDLRGQGSRLWLCLPAGVLGGILGGGILLLTEERTFRSLVPFLILLASGLLAVQGPVRSWLDRTRTPGGPVPLDAREGALHPGAGDGTAPDAGDGTAPPENGGAGRHRQPARDGLAAATERKRSIPLFLAVAVAAIYGGYFGAGLSVIVLAALGLLLDDSLTRLNALKQAVAFAVNLAAAIFFLFSGHVVWPVALAMAGGALIGGAIGGRLAGRIRPIVLRWTVVAIGTVVGVVYLVR